LQISDAPSPAHLAAYTGNYIILRSLIESGEKNANKNFVQLKTI